MIKEKPKIKALIYSAALSETLLNEIKQRSGDFTIPAVFRPLPKTLYKSNIDQKLTLVLFDSGNPDLGTENFPEEWTRVLKAVPSIAIYPSTPPPINDFKEYQELRDLVPSSAIDQIAFAINREINTQHLDKELQRKSDLLKITGRKNQNRPQYDQHNLKHFEPESSDFPTWVLNRQEFIKYIDKHVYLLNQNDHAALALIEIDHYKPVSDGSEKEFNARCMAVVANIILTRCKPSDVLAYYDEKVFALFSTRYSPRSISTFAEHLRLSISESLLEGENDFTQLKCSIGICFWSAQIANTTELIARTQQACGKASIGDGNQVHIYQNLTTSFEVLDEQSKYKEQVYSALKEDRFRLVYQPIVNVSHFNEENYAVLLRMIDRRGMHLSPDRFLPIAESTGLIDYIDQWVIQQTVELAKRSSSQRKNRNFFLKISGHSLSSEKIQKCLQYYLKKAKIDGSCLIFQVDYSEYIHNPKRVESFIKNISKARCKIAFDHFGFAEYSVNELTDLSIDFIKIDGTFSRGLLKTPSHETTIRKIQKAAQSANIKTVAKSVEDANTLALLWNVGVDFVQGYFIQEPNDKMRFDFMSI